jgi:hypothetical protein
MHCPKFGGVIVFAGAVAARSLVTQSASGKMSAGFPE